MLTTLELVDHLNHISYKPGWEIYVYDGRWEGQHIVIRTEIEDTFNPGEKLVLDVHSMLPPMPSLDYFNEWLAWRLGRLEIHEMREFLKMDGKPIFDPHAEYAERDENFTSGSLVDIL